MSDTKYKIIYRYENPIGSMLADTFTFATIVGSFWFNYQFIDGNNVLDVLLFVGWLSFAISKASNIRRMVEYSKQDLEAFKDEDRNQGASTN